MLRKFLFAGILLSSFTVSAQTPNDSIPQLTQNTADRLLTKNQKSPLTIGGYGEITYNQPESDNGELDIQRLVLMFGYKFNDRTQFITEIEFEHVSEVFVEQAFIQYSLNDNINLRGGLMLVPMGILNEYHEPTTFNGVERPSVDGSIIPTTWREIGIGVSGRSNEYSLKYQAYIFNGFASVNGTKVLGGSNGLRSGRQKGAKSTINTPNLSAKVDYYGIDGLRLGLAGYFGRTQAADDVDMIDGADIGIAMIGLDARYTNKRFAARGQIINASLSDTDAYNTLNSADLGSKLQGWYLESSYNLLSQDKKQQLWAFARYEDYDTHADVDGSLTRNRAYDRNDITFGLSYKLAPGVVVKGDYQIKSNEVAGSDATGQLNFGIGVWF